MAAFSVMFFIVFFAYAQIGYLMFGVHMSDFATFKVQWSNHWHKCLIQNQNNAASNILLFLLGCLLHPVSTDPGRLRLPCNWARQPLLWPSLLLNLCVPGFLCPDEHVPGHHQWHILWSQRGSGQQKRRFPGMFKWNHSSCHRFFKHCHYHCFKIFGLEQVPLIVVLQIPRRI